MNSTRLQDIGTDKAQPYIAGDTLTASIVIMGIDENGVEGPVDLDDWALEAARYVIAVPTSNGFSVVVSKTLGDGLVVADAAAGELDLTVPAGDTLGLSGRYHQELELRAAGNIVRTAFIGRLQVTPGAIE